MQDTNRNSRIIEELQKKTVANGCTEAEALSAADKIKQLRSYLPGMTKSDREIKIQIFLETAIKCCEEKLNSDQINTFDIMDFGTRVSLGYYKYFQEEFKPNKEEDEDFKNKIIGKICALCVREKHRRMGLT